MKILAMTPTHPAYGVRARTWESIRAAMDAYDGAVDWVVMSGDNPHDEPNDNVKRQQNKARRMALEGGYDALLSVEADMIIPPHTIDGLLACDADIAYGLYVWRHNLRRWSAYWDIGLFGGYSYTLKPSLARELWGQIVDVKGLGMGCTLIKRNVLERLPFRLYENMEGDWVIDEYRDEVTKLSTWQGVDIDLARDHKRMFCTDWMLAMDADHYGFTQRANLGVACGHIDNDGTVIWPHPAPGDLYYTERANGVSDGC